MVPDGSQPSHHIGIQRFMVLACWHVACKLPSTAATRHFGARRRHVAYLSGSFLASCMANTCNVLADNDVRISGIDRESSFSSFGISNGFRSSRFNEK
ncbi:hypothetical protein HN011_005404 [Eciton burchellii]|nr:hypothetical protein HN011_005404 [Eciton burchellii]